MPVATGRGYGKSAAGPASPSSHRSASLRRDAQMPARAAGLGKTGAWPHRSLDWMRASARTEGVNMRAPPLSIMQGAMPPHSWPAASRVRRCI